MSSILAFTTNDAFSPNDIETMSAALDNVCEALNINREAVAQEVNAVRIVEFTGRGERDKRRLFERLVTEANGGRLNGALP
jgi:hypothetical protein